MFAKKPSKVLLIVSSRIGDVIFSTPAIELLHRCRPSFLIDVIAPSLLAAQVLENNPAINQVFTAPPIETIHAIANDYVYILSMHDSAACQAYFRHFSNVAMNSNHPLKGQHWVDHYLAFIRRSFGINTPAIDHYQLFPQPSHFNYIQSILHQHQVQPNDVLIGVHMGSSRIVRRRKHFIKRLFLRTGGTNCWPFTRFSQLAAQLSQSIPNLRFVLVGTTEEKPLAKYFKKHPAITIDLIGKTKALDLVALMNSLNLFITADTGPLHAACASNVPVVTLFANTSPKQSGPYPAAPHRVVLKEDSMESISVAKVYQTAISLLNLECTMAKTE